MRRLDGWMSHLQVASLPSLYLPSNRMTSHFGDARTSGETRACIPYIVHAALYIKDFATRVISISLVFGTIDGVKANWLVRKLQRLSSHFVRILNRGSTLHAFSRRQVQHKPSFKLMHTRMHLVFHRSLCYCSVDARGATALCI